MRNEDNLNRSDNNELNYYTDHNRNLRQMQEKNRLLNIYLNFANSLFFGLMFYFYTSDESYYGSASECINLLASGKQLLIYFELIGIVTLILIIYHLFNPKREESDNFFMDFSDIIFFFFSIYTFVLLFKATDAISRGEKCGSLKSLVLIWIMITFAIYMIFFLCIWCICAILLISR